MAGSTWRSGGPAACTGISTKNALAQAAMTRRPSCPRRCSSAAPSAAGANRMPEVLGRPTWLAGLAIPHFTLVHPKIRPCSAPTRWQPSCSRVPDTPLTGLVTSKSFRPGYSPAASCDFRVAAGWSSWGLTWLYASAAARVPNRIVSKALLTQIRIRSTPDFRDDGMGRPLSCYQCRDPVRLPPHPEPQLRYPQQGHPHSRHLHET